VVIGVPLGLLMGRVRVADDVLGPMVDLAMVTPMVVVELALLAIGIGNVILDYQASFRAAQMFAVVGLIVVQSVVVMAGLRLLGNRVAGTAPESVQLEQGVG
jgi:ABC-type nitrate/sulfonate/bicarbonate transport system permease component